MYGNRNGGFGGGRGGDFREPPVKVGEEITVTIEAIGAKGDGIAKKDGFVLFIPNVKEGQKVKVRVTKVLRKVGFAEPVGESSGEASEGAPAEEAPAESAPAEESTEDSEDFGEEAPAEDAPAEEAPAEKAPAEETPAEEAPAEEAPAEEKSE